MITSRDLLQWIGPSAMKKFGPLTRKLAPANRGGEDFLEVFTAASPDRYGVNRNGTVTAFAANRSRLDWYDWDADGIPDPFWLLENTRTQIALWNRDLTNAAWTKTNVSAVKDQTGIDGVASSASRITASAGNGTCLQAIVLGSSARFQTCYVKRLVGSGTINMTMDNGATWTAIVPTTAWTRVSIPTQTLANPTVGFRIVTNGDSIAVDMVQNENGTFATSVIPTTTVAVARSVEQASFTNVYQPMAETFYIRGLERGTVALGGNARVFNLGSAAGTGAFIRIESSGSFYQAVYTDGTTTKTATLGVAPTANQLFELLLTITSAGVITLEQSVALAASTTASATALALPSAWADSSLWLNSRSTNNVGYLGLDSFIRCRGAFPMADFRTLIG